MSKEYARMSRELADKPWEQVSKELEQIESKYTPTQVMWSFFVIRPESYKFRGDANRRFCLHDLLQLYPYHYLECNDADCCKVYGFNNNGFEKWLNKHYLRDKKKIEVKIDE
jgi:hypothetical protein